MTTGVIEPPAKSPAWSLRAWAQLRVVPLTGLVILVVVGMNYSLWWDVSLHHDDAWLMSFDLWRSYVSTSAALHGHLGAIYTQHTELITFPGALILLSPAVALSDALHLSIGLPFTNITYPTAWVVLGPYEMAVGCSFLFAVDALARRFGVSTTRRLALCLVEVVALWNVVVRNGHPEDAVAVALVLWTLMAVADGRWTRAGWLLGVAVCVQPLTLTTVPLVLAMGGPRRLVKLAAQVALPSAVLLIGPVLAAPSRTLHNVTLQPISVLQNHPTPWLPLAGRTPNVFGGGPDKFLVVAGPERFIVVAVAMGVAWIASRQFGRIEEVAWLAACVLGLRLCFEPVVVSYYVWPAFALAMAVAGRRGPVRFVGVSAAVCVATVLSEYFGLRGNWSWWLCEMACLAVALGLAAPSSLGRRAGGRTAAPADDRLDHPPASRPETQPAPI